MSTGEDDDIKLQRASASLIADFQRLLPHLLRNPKHDSVRVALMYKACLLVSSSYKPEVLSLTRSR
jgi:hypothetical protein